jgi:hypothetical protein
VKRQAPDLSGSGAEREGKMNCIIEIAKTEGRDYITPEDVADALKKFDVNKVRLDVLEVLGKQVGFGAEDCGLCAFVAWEGKPAVFEIDEQKT